MQSSYQINPTFSARSAKKTCQTTTTPNKIVFLAFPSVNYLWINCVTFKLNPQANRKHRFLVNDQRDAQFFSMYLFLILTLYMFRAHRAHHQERQIVSIQPLVAVGGRVVCRSPTYTRHGHRHGMTATRGCIDTICLS